MQLSGVIESSEPLVVIIGRPNVGKSTLFNRLVGRRRAIVGDEPGITRDRIHGQVHWCGRTFEVVDTGGLIPDDEAQIPVSIMRQARAAIEAAQVILLNVDVRQGLTPVDEELARLLHQLGKRVFVLANKTDTTRLEPQAEEFRRLGFDQVFPISAEHGHGVADMLDVLIDCLEPVKPASDSACEKEIKLAVIGRPNVGKSTLVNQLVGAERVIVSPEPGTTRDAVDTQLEFDGCRFHLIDTAGIRRHSRVHLQAEKISVIMARKHIERADVAVLLVDAVERLGTNDARIAGFAHDAGKSLIIAVNKWDAIEKNRRTAGEFEAEIRDRFKFLGYAPVIFISALTGVRVIKVLDLAKEAFAARHQRVPTGELNRFFRRYLDEPRVPLGGLKIHYITQAGINPPTFVIFTNHQKKKLPVSLERYLINRLRESYRFFATPIRIKHKVKA